MSLPPFRYYGGKTTIAPQIAAMFSPHKHYVEPFAGSLAVLLAKPPSKMETVNDLDKNLMTFWRVLRDRPDDLGRVCALTPHSRAEREACADLATDDDLERARRMWVLLTQARDPTAAADWRYLDGKIPMSGYLRGYLARMPAAAARLLTVSLECRPALEVIANYGRFDDTLIYADPPYPASTRNGDRYACELSSDEAHIELSEALRAVPAAVVLSGYACPLYDKLYGDWHRAEIATQSGNAAGDRDRIEVLWSNRPFSIMTLW